MKDALEDSGGASNSASSGFPALSVVWPDSSDAAEGAVGSRDVDGASSSREGKENGGIDDVFSTLDDA